MATTEIQLPDRIDSEITRLVEQGEFVNRDQAIEEILSLGVSAYDTDESADDDPYEEWDMQATEDRQDPSMRDGPSDGRTF